jgi:predicted metal-dependent enzyme (double-stranded beta helix superfamily)
MRRRVTNLVTTLLLVASASVCAGSPQDESSNRPTDLLAAHSLDQAIQETMAEAREAVDELGVTEAAMQRIQAALRRLAEVPGLKERSELREVHGGGVASAVLRSEGSDGLTLILAQFQPGMSTPIHDHGTWAVAYVLEGQDRYVQWNRVDDGGNPQRAQLEVKYERILSPGDAVYWFNPPYDIHSQEALEGITWELLLLGRNPLHGTLHYFDPSTGRVTTKAPVAAGADEGDR